MSIKVLDKILVSMRVSITEEMKRELLNDIKQDLGLPFTRWSLHKLKDYVIERGVVETISHEEVRQTLKKANISSQRTKTWKESSDPDFEVKKKNKKALQAETQ